VAKTISAYDKEVSGDLYGSGSRYYKQDDLANRRHLLAKNREQGFSGAEPYNSEGAPPNVGQEGREALQDFFRKRSAMILINLSKSFQSLLVTRLRLLSIESDPAREWGQFDENDTA
jgi:hypothetical protein